MAITSWVGRPRTPRTAAFSFAAASLLVLSVAQLLVLLSAVSGQDTALPQLKVRPAGPGKAPPGGTDQQIILDVQVTDKSGTPIGGLKEQDFTLLDDKQPQKIVVFNAVNAGAAVPSDPAVEIVLVVDAVNAPLHAVSYEREQIKKFLLQNGGRLATPVSLVIFSGAGTKVQNASSRDGNALAALYDQYETGLRSSNLNRSVYGAEERLDLSLQTLTGLADYERTRPGRKLVIWLSPGWPLLSGINALSTKNARLFFNSIMAASAELRQARITLYSIDPLGLADQGESRTTLYKEFLKAVTSPSQALPGDLGLQVLAIQSGGRVLNFSTDLTDAIANCAVEAAAFYVLSFDPIPADHQDDYHSLQVVIDKPKMTARTRTGYYSQP